MPHDVLFQFGYNIAKALLNFANMQSKMGDVLIKIESIRIDNY